MTLLKSGVTKHCAVIAFSTGMELYSTTLWHLQKEVALSALAQDLVDTERVCAEVT
jgi:hypothetical protein